MEAFLKVLLKSLYYFAIIVIMYPGLYMYGCSSVKEREWPEQVKEIKYFSSCDSTYQPALFFKPINLQFSPLLVALHTWSSDYQQKASIPYAEWCITNNWVFIHPNFRGPNNNPHATGSELVVADILCAVDYAKKHAKVDTNRIYLVGTSGGGYHALLMAGRFPNIWAGVSTWVPILDLQSWYYENKATGRKYANEIVMSCGGTPGESAEVDLQYKMRSPITYLKNAVTLPLDINAGITDGHTGSVPISHSLRAFNLLALENDRISTDDINYFVEKAQVPPHLSSDTVDPSYGSKPPLFRRISGNARITIFEGGHEIIFEAALNWLAKQKKERF